MNLEIIKQRAKAFVINDKEFKFSCSIGVATYPNDGDTTDVLLATADKAMYKAKHKSGGTYEM